MSSVQNVSNDLLATMNGVKTQTGSSVEDEQNRFMTLLVAQMRNQDPLNPLDNAQVTSQLAQLSTVSGIEKLNATLQSLQASYQTSQSMQAATMIGHGVLVPGDSLQLAEGKTVLGVELGSDVDSVKVNVLDEDGKVVHTLDLGPQKAGVVPVAWDGMIGEDEQLPDGAYKFEVVATRGGEKVGANPLSFGMVLSVSMSPQGVKLNLSNAQAVRMDEIREIL